MAQTDAAGASKFPYQATVGGASVSANHDQPCHNWLAASLLSFFQFPFPCTEKTKRLINQQCNFLRGLSLMKITLNELSALDNLFFSGYKPKDRHLTRREIHFYNVWLIIDMINII